MELKNFINLNISTIIPPTNLEQLSIDLREQYIITQKTNVITTIKQNFETRYANETLNNEQRALYKQKINNINLVLKEREHNSMLLLESIGNKAKQLLDDIVKKLTESLHQEMIEYCKSLELDLDFILSEDLDIETDNGVVYLNNLIEITDIFITADEKTAKESLYLYSLIYFMIFIRDCWLLFLTKLQKQDKFREFLQKYANYILYLKAELGKKMIYLHDNLEIFSSNFASTIMVPYVTQLNKHYQKGIKNPINIEISPITKTEMEQTKKQLMLSANNL